MKLLFAALFFFSLVFAGCQSSPLSNADKARMTVQEYNHKTLDEANYRPVSFTEFQEYKDAKRADVKYRLTHRFNYGNKGREREYYYYLDASLTKVIRRKRTAWDKSN